MIQPFEIPPKFENQEVDRWLRQFVERLQRDLYELEDYVINPNAGEAWNEDISAGSTNESLSKDGLFLRVNEIGTHNWELKLILAKGSTVIIGVGVTGNKIEVTNGFEINVVFTDLEFTNTADAGTGPTFLRLYR